MTSNRETFLTPPAPRQPTEYRIRMADDGPSVVQHAGGQILNVRRGCVLVHRVGGALDEVREKWIHTDQHAAAGMQVALRQIAVQMLGDLLGVYPDTDTDVSWAIDKLAEIAHENNFSAEQNARGELLDAIKRQVLSAVARALAASPTHPNL